MDELPQYHEALELALEKAIRLKFETLAIDECGGRVLAEAVIADRDLPPFNRSMMDGYALRAKEYQKNTEFPIAAEVHAGASPDVKVPKGACVKIATGAAVPKTLNAVIQHELSDRNDPVSFSINSIEPGNAIHPRGSDAKKGDELIAAGAVLSGWNLGIAAMAGCAELDVYRKPIVTILTSGDEVKPIDEPLLNHHIRNSNGPMLVECMRRFGIDKVSTTHIPDDERETIKGFNKAALSSDLVITVGGVSAGERDHFPAAYKSMKVKLALQGAAIQPGKPIHVGRRSHGPVVVGLPGNPVSALAMAHLFVWPMVLKMQGADKSIRWDERTLAETVKANPKRKAFRPARINEDGSVTIPSWSGSGDLVHTATTDGLVALPIQEDAVEAGTKVPFLAWA